MTEDRNSKIAWCAPRCALAAKFTVLLPHLDERQRRLLMGAEARL